MVGVREKSEKELQDTFDMFLFRLGERMERLKDAVAEVGISLDYSLESLKEIETFVLQKGIDRNHDLYDDIACYIGEVVRKTFGGQWECCLDMKNNSMLYGMPVVSGYNKHGVLLSPYELLNIFLLRKKTGFLAHSIKMDVNPPMNPEYRKLVGGK